MPLIATHLAPNALRIPGTKKFRSNWFRVAVEGATSDKRTIKRSWLEQAAKNFNPSTYGARIWLEHFRSLLPDSPFKAYGDVLAVKTEEVEINGAKKLALFAQVEPTPDLIAMNKAKQKIYTSIEIDDSFSDTGEAYIVGLAVTDSPASLGTDVLSFSAQKPESSPFKDRHYSATSMFTEAVETELQFDEIEDKPSLGAQLFSKVQALCRCTRYRTSPKARSSSPPSPTCRCTGRSAPVAATSRKSRSGTASPTSNRRMRPMWLRNTAWVACWKTSLRSRVNPWLSASPKPTNAALARQWRRPKRRRSSLWPVPPPTSISWAHCQDCQSSPIRFEGPRGTWSSRCAVSPAGGIGIHQARAWSNPRAVASSSYYLIFYFLRDPRFLNPIDPPQNQERVS